MWHTLQIDVHLEASTERMRGDTSFRLCKYTCTELPPVLSFCHFTVYYSFPEKKSVLELNDQSTCMTSLYIVLVVQPVCPTWHYHIYRGCTVCLGPWGQSHFRPVSTGMHSFYLECAQLCVLCWSAFTVSWPPCQVFCTVNVMCFYGWEWSDVCCSRMLTRICFRHVAFRVNVARWNFLLLWILLALHQVL